MSTLYAPIYHFFQNLSIQLVVPTSKWALAFNHNCGKHWKIAFETLLLIGANT
jgi:hypothetical protein